MTTRLCCIILVISTAPACGSRRIAGYLEELEDCSTGTSETGVASGTDTTHDATSSGEVGSAEGDAGTSEGPETTGTGAADGTETADDSETTAGTTEAARAVCGNGVLEGSGAEPEECDDGNVDPEDGCSETCALDRRAFVTSVSYQGAAVESLYIADALCANLADDQGFADPLKYRAWLSDSTTDARDRFTMGRGRLVLVNGLVLAQSWSALLAGELEHPFEVTEKSETKYDGVWTGTRPDGTAVPGAEHCDDWSTSWALTTGHYGYSDRTTPEWTLSASDDNPIGCAVEFALYCLQSL